MITVDLKPTIADGSSFVSASQGVTRLGVPIGIQSMVSGPFSVEGSIDGEAFFPLTISSLGTASAEIVAPGIYAIVSPAVLLIRVRAAVEADPEAPYAIFAISD